MLVSECISRPVPHPLNDSSPSDLEMIDTPERVK